MNGFVQQSQAAIDTLVGEFPNASFAVFGSVARGQATSTSDIDIFVVHPDAALRPSQMLAIARTDVNPTIDLNFISVSAENARRMWAQGRLLAVHLWREARIVHDPCGELGRLLSERPVLDIASEAQREAARLHPYRDVQAFNGNLLLCLAQDYSVGCSLSMLASAASGTPEFDRHRAFARLHAHAPGLEADVRQVESLEPFYVRVHGNAAVDLPWSPLEAGDARPRLEHRRALATLDLLCTTLAER